MICLNMIVKNEAHVILRCLSSIKPLIDYWVIVDTGSTDGTQDVIRNYLSEIPGELHQRAWIHDFAHSRNQALSLARGKGDYFLFIDADDRLVFSKSFSLPPLTLDCYTIPQYHTRKTKAEPLRLHNNVIFLIRDLPGIRWEGALHEYLLFPSSNTSSTMPGVISEYFHDGARGSDPHTADQDITILEKMYMQDPSNGRTITILAGYYRDKGDYKNAIRFYKKRLKLSGREDEIAYARQSLHKLSGKC